MGRRALISVTDKSGAAEFARGLVSFGYSILSTGGTYREIHQAGVTVEEIADYTGFPEMMDGRIKTLHPKVHGGILARRDHEGDQEALDEHGIDWIDLVAVNLYAFRSTVRKDGVERREIVESIDIGGPAMIRSAAKNHDYVTVVVDPGDYDQVLQSLRDHDGILPISMRRDLAGKALNRVEGARNSVRGVLADDRDREWEWFGRGHDKNSKAAIQQNSKWGGEAD